MYDEKTLYDTVIASRTFYRAFSAEYLKDIQKHGLNPTKNPYVSMQQEISAFFELLSWLDTNSSFSHTQQWDDYEVKIPTIVRVLLSDLQTNRLELTPDKNRMKYYAQVAQNTGGAIPAGIKKATTAILTQEPQLPKGWDIHRIDKLHQWACKRGEFPIVCLQIRGDSPSLSNARIVVRNGRKEYLSPFGSFETFQEVAQTTEFEKIISILQDDTQFYLRIINKIPANEIEFTSIN